MRLAALACVAALLAACAPNEQSSLAPTASPNFAYNDPTRVDLVGLPDLIVDGPSTQQHWVVRNEKLAENFCSVIEGGVQPGLRRLLRFTVTTPNVGDADVFIGSPLDHYNANDGLYELSTCHNHFHFKNYATYKLIDAATGKVWKAAKRGFCMLDTDPYDQKIATAPRNFWNCGSLTGDGFQGISKGWSDTYTFKLGGQYFVLDGGDGQPVVPPGNYIIQVEVNPAYAPVGKQGCPRVTDPATGLCHQFTESSYANNTTSVAITIPINSGRTGYGPEKDSAIETTESVEH